MNGKYFNPARSKKLFQLVFLAFFLILFAALGNALLDKNEKSGEVILVLDFGDNKKTYQTFFATIIFLILIHLLCKKKNKHSEKLINQIISSSV